MGKRVEAYQKNLRGQKTEHWYYKFMIDGVQYPAVCTHTTDKREADRMAQDAYDLAKGEAVKAKKLAVANRHLTKDMTLDALCISYWNRHVLKKDLKDQTQIGKQLHVIRDTIGPDVMVSMIDDDVVERFTDARREHVSKRTGKPLAPQTRNHELMRLQLMLGHASVVEKVGMQVINWKRFRIEKRKLGTKPPRFITPEETAELFKVIRADYQPIVAFAISTGLRRRNLVDLTWDMVHERIGTIIMKQKGGRELPPIIITPGIASILEAQKPHKTAPDGHVFTFIGDATMRNNKTGKSYVKGERYPVTYWGLGSAWKTFMKNLDGARITIHDLRKIFISDFSMAAGLTQASISAGHADEKITQAIYRSIPEPSRAAAAKLADDFRLASGRIVPFLEGRAVPQIVPQQENG